MITKTTKTIVFAALIAAMVLPFSGMQSVYADGLNLPANATVGNHGPPTGDPTAAAAADAAEKLAAMYDILDDLNEEIIECADPIVIAGLEAKKLQVLAEIAALTA